MQVLYQIDLNGAGDDIDRAALVEGVDHEHDRAEVCEAAVDLALAAWACRRDADGQVEQLAPDWPTHRQPPVDRAILRLAWYEMTTGHAPIKVAINEAVELAKHFCSENSPPFINGVLDKLAKAMESDPAATAPDDPPDPVEPPELSDPPETPAS